MVCPAHRDKRHDPKAAFAGVARPGEWFALQLGVWARNTSVEVLSVNISGDAELSTNFSCMSLGGNDYSGQAFTKLWYLPAGRLSSLWMGVQVPAAGTSASTLKGHMAVILRTSNDTATINIPVSIEVSGAPIVNAGDNDVCVYFKDGVALIICYRVATFLGFTLLYIRVVGFWIT